MVDSRINFVGLIQKAYMQSDMTDEEFAAFREEIEKEFDIRTAVPLRDGVLYKLKPGVNGMRWVDGAEISITNTDHETDVQYAISTTLNTMFLLLFSTGWAIYDGVKNDVSFYTFLPFFITLPLAWITARSAKAVFRLRLRGALKRAIADRVEISDEQAEWMNDPGRCPGCGHTVQPEQETCSMCDLTLKQK